MPSGWAGKRFIALHAPSRPFTPLSRPTPLYAPAWDRDPGRASAAADGEGGGAGLDASCSAATISSSGGRSSRPMKTIPGAGAA